jgi:hypothetical protein
MQNNVAIRGGYRGPTGGGDPDDRDITTFESILSGDYGNDDDPNDPNSDNENSYHIATAIDVDTTAVLDGFRIIGGNANGTSGHLVSIGGGMHHLRSGAIVTNCTFSGNSAGGCGGGMHNGFDGAPTVTGCSFTGNSATEGGGMYNYWGDPCVIDCTFSENSADEGGGMYNIGSDPIVHNCTFSGNSAHTGGGMYNDQGDFPITNCTFSGNSATYDGGAMYNCCGSSTTVVNCTLSENSASQGGGIYNSSSTPTLGNGIFWGNSDAGGSDESAQIHAENIADVAVTYSCIQGCSSYCSDANDMNIGADPLFVREPNDGGDGWGDDPCTPGVDESLNDDYGDLRLIAGSPCVNTGNNNVDTHAYTPEIDPLPDTDLDGRPRFADGDCNDTNIVDMGAYEFTSTYIGDFDVDCDVDFVDYTIFANSWLTDELLVDIAPTPAGDGIIDERDLGILCDNWLFGK